MVQLMVAGYGADRLDAEARRGQVEQQETDPRLWLALGRGTDEAEHAVGEMGVGGPDLRAVEDIIPAIAVGAKLERGEIRPRARFRKALAPIILARQDARQIMRALFRRPVMHDDRRDHFQPHWGEVGGAGARAFGGEDVALHPAPPWSAMLGGPDRKSTRLNSSHYCACRPPPSA